MSAEIASLERVRQAADALRRRGVRPTADRIIETLSMAREVGGTELPTVLRSLSQYLRADAAVRGEVDARASARAAQCAAGE